MTTAAIDLVDALELRPDRTFPTMIDRRWEVRLDGRPMGAITQLNNTIRRGWAASSVNGVPLGGGMSKREALEALL